MQHALHVVRRLPFPRQLVLGASLIAILAVFMPWHSVGVATLSTEKVFSGLADQNFIIGALVLGCMALTAALILLPLLGGRLRLPVRESIIIMLAGANALQLTFALTIMHATALSRAANIDLRLGINLALIASGAVLIGGYLMHVARERDAESYAEPLTTVPRVRHMQDVAPRATMSQAEEAEEMTAQPTVEDRRMRLDI